MNINKVLPEGSRRRQLVKSLFFESRIADHLAHNFTTINPSELERIQASLVQNYFSRETESYLQTEAGKQDLKDHLITRLELSRKFTVPWLDQIRPLHGANILEIGCGTGASTVALAEQGATVRAIDIDQEALYDAKIRCETYGMKVEFHHMNAMEAARFFRAENFDFIIFWACLEHMTLDERLASMRDTWAMLPAGALWCVTDTPNRLHFFDSHTSEMPFFDWLPDQLAMQYARFSPREKFRDWAIKQQGDKKDQLDFSRWGRGLSFHEFELAMEPLENLNIVSCMSIFHRRRRWLAYLKSVASRSYRYESFLNRMFPTIHRGFLQPYLNLVIRKN